MVVETNSTMIQFLVQVTGVVALKKCACSVDAIVGLVILHHDTRWQGIMLKFELTNDSLLAFQRGLVTDRYALECSVTEKCAVLFIAGIILQRLFVYPPGREAKIHTDC